MKIRKYLARAFVLPASAIAGAVSLACLLAAPAGAATFTWSAGSGTDLNWSDNANWNPAGPVTGGTITFNNTGGTSSSTSGTTSIVDQSVTISSLTFTNTGTTTNSYQNLVIGSTGSGTTLTVNGGVTFGLLSSSNANIQTNVSISGTGALAVSNTSANLVVGLSSSTATSFADTVDMSGLSSFTFSGSNFDVGAWTGSGGSRSTAGILNLAQTSSITSSATIDIGDNGAATNASSITSVLNLGTGTNTIYANQFNVGRTKANGSVAFNPTAGSAAGVTIRGSLGGSSRVTTISIGDHIAAASTSANGTMDFSLGQVNAMIATLYIGTCDNTGSTGDGIGTLIIGPNPNSVVDVNTMNLATVGSGRTTATVKIEGGTFAFGTIPAALGNATISFSGGSTICSNTASSTEAAPFNMGTNGADSIVTFGNPGLGYTGSLTFNGPGTLAGSTTFQVNVPTTINGSLADGGFGSTLTMAGPGLLILGGSASGYFGGTTVSAGTLQLGNANALGSTGGSLGVNGGVLDLFGNSPSVNTVTLNGGTILNSGTAASLNSSSGFTLNSGTASAALSGAGAVSMSGTVGTGFVLLSGSNSYTGGTTVSGGTMQLGNGSALGTPNGTLPLQLTGGLLDLNGQSVTTGGLAGNGGAITSTANGGVLVLTPTVPASYSGTITGKAGITLNAPGSTQTLSAPNNYTGPTTVSAGTLALAAPGTLGTGLTTVTPGATLDVSNYNPGGYNFTSGTLAAGPTPPGGTDVNGSLNATGALLNISGGTGSTMTINGNLSLSGGTVSLAQGSTVVMAGGGNLSLGGTDVIAPTAQLNNGVYTLFTYSNLSAGGTADLAMGGLFGSSPRQNFTFGTSGGTAITLTVAGFVGNLQWSGGSNHTWDTGMSKSWYNLSTSAADFFFGADNATFNDTPGTATTVSISGNVAPSSLTVTNSNVAYTFSGTGSIIGGTSLVMTGPGTLTINTNNGYTGGTSVDGGLLNLGNSGALGSGTVTISGGSIDNISGAAMTLAGNIPQNWNNSFAFRGSSPLNLGTGPVTLGTSATVTLGGSGALTVAGPISDGGNNNSLTVDGPGALVLAASNSYGGGTNLNSGLLVINNNGALGPGSLTISGGSIDCTVAGITVAGNPQNWNADVTFLGTQNLNLGAGAVALGSSRTVTVNAGVLTVAGAISDSGSGYSLTKAGPGSLNLGGQNIYGGDTMIAQGTLQMGTTGAIPNGAGAGNVDFTGAANSAVLDLNGNDTTINGLSQPAPSTTNLVVNNLSGTNTLTVGNNDATSTYAGVLADNNNGNGGVLALAKTGAGVLTLGGTNLFTGPTAVGGGTLALAPGSGLSSATSVTFSGNALLSLGANNQAITGLAVADSFTGTVTGGGSLTVNATGDLLVGGANPNQSQTLVMSNLDAFTYSGSSRIFDVGCEYTGAALSSGTGTVLLAASNMITANLFGVASRGSQDIAVGSVSIGLVYLGQANAINANTIDVGTNNNTNQRTSTTGTLAFAPGSVNPTLTIDGASSGTRSRAEINVGVLGESTDPQYATGTIDLVAGVNGSSVLNGYVDQMVLGNHTRFNNAFPASGTFNMGGGTLDANGITIGEMTSGTVDGASASGTFSLNGGTVLAGTITMGLIAAGQTEPAGGTLNVNSGLLSAGTITSGSGSATFNWTSGIIANYNPIYGLGGDAAESGLTVSVPTLTLAGTGMHSFWIDAGQAGAVSSLISGSGALASVGPGTLTLSGTSNTFTGGLYVSNGTVILTNNEAVADGEGLTVGNPSVFAPIVLAAPVPSAAAITPVPEPATLLLLAAMLAGAAACRRRGTGHPRSGSAAGRRKQL